MPVLKLEELTYPQISALLSEGRTELIWPVGTLEAHGRHAPVGTDNFCAEEIAWRLGDRVDWPVAPTLNYGITSGLVAYPGGVRIDKELYAKLTRCILENYLQMGFRRIVIINGHGGNTETLSNVIRELITEDRGKRHLMLIDWFQLDSEALEEVYNRPPGHAALDETACVVAYRPELLDPGAMDPENHTVLTRGIVSAPYPSAMIYYADGDASPDFDRGKATKFMDKVLDRIEELLRREVELFEKSFGDGKEG